MGWSCNEELVRTLKFKLEPEDTESLDLLREEFRSCYNQYIKLTRDLETTDRRTLEQQEVETDLVENTRQIALETAAKAVENYFELRDVQKNASYPRQKDTPMTATLNHRDGYTVEDPSTVKISTIPYNRVKASITGRREDQIFLRKALNGQFQFGTADVLKKNGDHYLHITIRTEEVPEIQVEQDNTFIGVDINESNVMLTAAKEDGEILDTLYLDYNKLKDKRNEYFTKKKRLKKAGKWSILEKLSAKEEAATQDFCHKLTRYAVRWIKQFDNPVVVMEDLTGMTEDIEYGAKMNKRLHRLPFRKLQQFLKYKSEWSGVPVEYVDAEYTSQRCPLCGDSDNTTRRSHRFKCPNCSHQDHADRNASINIAFRAAATFETSHDTDSVVPSPKNFPSFRRVRLTAAGLSEQADPSPRTTT
ncbi:RNA-guided endonuclease InsQ/TnpB family protein [Natrinema sp. H-ect4]|uniref:RNA-guided endonuclease InsQ/TnpB family protein n=1 Tax=Natrinema sp. H-ect4 TaxID=3242699 RepID=UPI0035A86A77